MQAPKLQALYGLYVERTPFSEVIFSSGMITFPQVAISNRFQHGVPKSRGAALASKRGELLSFFSMVNLDADVDGRRLTIGSAQPRSEPWRAFVVHMSLPLLRPRTSQEVPAHLKDRTYDRDTSTLKAELRLENCDMRDCDAIETEVLFVIIDASEADVGRDTLSVRGKDTKYTNKSTIIYLRAISK